MCAFTVAWGSLFLSKKKGMGQTYEYSIGSGNGEKSKKT